jgi:hypothetical protein
MDEGRQPPYGTDLAPWATDIAKELHRRFGDDVELVVGAFSYQTTSQGESTQFRKMKSRTWTPR